MLADIHDQLAKPQMLALTKTCTKTHALLHKTAWPPSAFLARGGKGIAVDIYRRAQSGLSSLSPSGVSVCIIFHRHSSLAVLKDVSAH